MYTRGSKFYADYRTPDGERHRKSFPTAAEAIAYENKQRTAALKRNLKALKAGPKLSPLPTSSRAISNRTRNVKATTVKLRRASLSKFAGTCRPIKSSPRTSPKRSRS